MTILAKAYPQNAPLDFQTIEGHTIDALKILKSYIEINHDTITQFCNRWQLQPENFMRSLFIIVFLHDIGKFTRQFQDNIRQGRSSQKCPHAFFAMSIIKNIDYPWLLDLPIEKAVILGHHTQLNNSIYAGYEAFSKPILFENEIIEFCQNSEKIYCEMGFNRWFTLNSLIIKSFPKSSKILSFTDDEVVDLKRAFYNHDLLKKVRLKSIYCYMTSILKTCDYYSSANFSDYAKDYSGSEGIFNSVLEIPQKYVVQVNSDDPFVTIMKNNQPYDYQKNETGKICGDVPEYGLLFAPCGRGKTETSLIWSLKSLSQYKRNKIIYAMPTQITSNAMWQRVCESLGGGNTKKEQFESGREFVGLFHGKSFIKLKEERKQELDEDLDELDLDEIKSENFKGNVFFKPVTVTTIDHLFYSFVHGFPQADYALGNLQNAVIVFDEVHYYNKKTLEHLVTLLEILKMMGIPHLLMSGTLPEFFVEKVKKINGKYADPYDDKDGLQFKPFNIEIHSEHLIEKDNVNENVINEIIDNCRKGIDDHEKKINQFVILNTIERSRSFYERLKDRLSEHGLPQNILLLHSQFTYSDRAEKERELFDKLTISKIRPYILVATQVVEISLDISCDVMYTELAPADALGQRGGRLNRKGKSWFSEGIEHIMKIYEPEELFSDKPKARPYEPELLSRTLEYLKPGPISYREFKHICDSVYQEYILSIPTKLQYIFKECCLFGYSPIDITFGDEERGRLLQIRDETYPQFDVIPWEHYLSDETNLIVENQVKIPLWRYKNDIKEHGDSTKFHQRFKKQGRREKLFWVTSIPYTQEMGFDFKSPTQSRAYLNSNVI